MVKREFLCRTPEETAALGFNFGNLLPAGSVVLLYGNLGAGKTLFVKGIAKAFGIEESDVSSPSFSLVNQYSTGDPGSATIYHIDLWRLSPGADFDIEISLGEILDLENAIVLIEWGDRLENYEINGTVFEVFIKGEGEEPRRIEITAAEEAFFWNMGAGEAECG